MTTCLSRQIRSGAIAGTGRNSPDQEITTSAVWRDHCSGRRRDGPVASRGPGAWRRRYAVSGAASSGGVLAEGDDDVVAEGLELALGVAGLAAAVGVPGVPAGSEVAVAGGGVVQQVVR